MGDLLNRISQIAAGRKRKSVFSDLKRLFVDKCKLSVGPHHVNAYGLSDAWADLREGSQIRKRIDFLRAPLPKGKWGRLLLEPRDTGKNISARVISYGEIEDEPDITQTFCSQSQPMSQRDVAWVRGRIEANRPDLVTKRDWGADQFTVNRPAGFGGDPTMMAGSPGGDVTGAHARKIRLIDIVCPESNRTYLKRKKLMEWFLELLKQRSPVTEVDGMGTRYQYHNLWEEILDHYASEFEIRIVGCYDEATGDMWYPWFTEEFLNQQEEHDPIGFRLQYMNQKATAGLMSFELSFLQHGEPPFTEQGGKAILDPSLALYLLTDTAQTEKNTSHTSRTAWHVVALGPPPQNMVYVLDTLIERLDPATVQKKFIEYYEYWRPYGLRYATMEDRGPSRSYMRTIPQLAIAMGLEAPRIVKIARSSVEDKDSRIGLLHDPFSQGKILFSSKFMRRPDMIHWDSRGRPVGVFVDEYLNYRPGQEDCYKDALDALGDIFAMEKGALICPPPPPGKEPKRALNNYEWSVKRATGKLQRIIRL